MVMMRKSSTELTVHDRSRDLTSSPQANRTRIISSVSGGMSVIGHRNFPSERSTSDVFQCPSFVPGSRLFWFLVPRVAQKCMQDEEAIHSGFIFSNLAYVGPG